MRRPRPASARQSGQQSAHNPGHQSAQHFDQPPHNATTVTPPPAQSPSQPPVREADARLEAMVRELSEALDKAEQENRRGRFYAQLAGALDLDDVLARTLEA